MSEPSQPPRRKVVINQKVMPGPAVSYDPVVSSHLQKIFNLVMMFKQKKQPDPVLIQQLVTGIENRASTEKDKAAAHLAYLKHFPKATHDEQEAIVHLFTEELADPAKFEHMFLLGIGHPVHLSLGAKALIFHQILDVSNYESSKRLFEAYAALSYEPERNMWPVIVQHYKFILPVIIKQAWPKIHFVRDCIRIKDMN